MHAVNDASKSTIFNRDIQATQNDKRKCAIKPQHLLLLILCCHCVSNQILSSEDDLIKIDGCSFDADRINENNNNINNFL